MILKWQEKSGTWRYTDEVTDLMNHGWCELSVAQKFAEEYDGVDTTIHFPMGAAHDQGNREVLPATEKHAGAGLYLVMLVRGVRQHWYLTTVTQAFLLSDEGKTVDNLLR